MFVRLGESFFNTTHIVSLIPIEGESIVNPEYYAIMTLHGTTYQSGYNAGQGVALTKDEYDIVVQAIEGGA
jgi:hypothetical protein